MDDFEKFYLLAVNFLAYRARSEKEVRDKLVAKNTPPEILEKIIATLKEQKFINDAEFAAMWTRNRTRLNPKSKSVIAMELRQKGINADIITKTLEGGGEDEERISDRDQARQLVEKKIDRYRHLPKAEIYQKLGGFLARRGFNWSTSKTAIDEALKLEYNK